ncbi:MAG: heavy-metal-associated domain-containing protein [Spirochaetaceae bacterium]|jgi:copper chaperone CopZ|nr:heavy-metal-associated domain-containing protein [Spirochaetaceae bacterium]
MTTRLVIEGMSCEHCVKAAANALKGISGVSEAAVDLKTKSAEIVHDGSVTFEALAAAIEGEGFSAQNLSTPTR